LEHAQKCGRVKPIDGGSQSFPLYIHGGVKPIDGGSQSFPLYELISKVIIRFVDIGENVDHYCLNFFS
jgi:hypothetical protein